MTNPSPLARGSRWRRPSGCAPRGSIPARAGEPRSRGRPSTPTRVHPRSRGGAPDRSLISSPPRGPSPLARGSPEVDDRPERAPGSIPARAGEPRWLSAPCPRCRVHPRSRGGARSSPSHCPSTTGPSPLARGSPSVAVQRAVLLGSIPARAGEPAHLAHAHRCVRVHPRSRGGATEGADGDAVDVGPSPLARGSHAVDQQHHDRRGSIPARAGEPWLGRHPACSSRVHPRSRGGADKSC